MSLLNLCFKGTQLVQLLFSLNLVDLHLLNLRKNVHALLCTQYTHLLHMSVTRTPSLVHNNILGQCCMKVPTCSSRYAIQLCLAISWVKLGNSSERVQWRKWFVFYLKSYSLRWTLHFPNGFLFCFFATKKYLNVIKLQESEW